MTRNKIYTILSALSLSAVLVLQGCEDNEVPTPDVSTDATASTAYFVGANASTDAPSLDLLINNVKVGTSMPNGDVQQTYTQVPITSNGVIANTNVRAKATTGNIGGVLGSSDLIFRAGNNNSNNFQAINGGYYTFIVVDSITRPRPVRTLNAANFGDTTYLNLATGQYISVVQRAALTSAERLLTTPIGTVPLGASDPGGIRFLVINDQLPLTNTQLPSPAASNIAIRFINASPNAPTVTANVGATAVANANGIFTYPLRLVAPFNPSVGSRSGVTLGFQTINIGGASASLNIVTRNAATTALIAELNNYQFDQGGVYTIVLSGNKNNASSYKLSVIKNK